MRVNNPKTDSASSPALTRRIKLAFVTHGISHFEVPLFRLCASHSELEFKVFYHLPVKQGVMDADYRQKIDWGDDLLAGYESLKSDNFAETRRAVTGWSPDVTLVYGYSWSGAPSFIVSNWLKRHPQIHRGTLNYYYDPRNLLRGVALRPFGRLLLFLFDAHHYGGAYSARVLRRSGVPESARFFVPFSVDTPFFLARAADPAEADAAAALRRNLGWEPKHQIVLFIAQHNWFKGPDIAIESFRQLAERHPDMRFIVVGSGSMTDEMKDAARQHIPQDRIHFAGFVPSLSTPMYYLASDVVLCSSRYETWARMLNEAMLCKCVPVISEIVPAAGDLVVDGHTGYVVQRPEPKLLVAAVERHFAMSLGERAAVREAARAKAKEFAYDPWIDNVVKAARYAINRHRSSRR
jgi:glycosyltransferase involved in cell wall biosynthesis